MDLLVIELLEVYGNIGSDGVCWLYVLDMYNFGCGLELLGVLLGDCIYVFNDLLISGGNSWIVMFNGEFSLLIVFNFLFVLIFLILGGEVRMLCLCVNYVIFELCINYLVLCFVDFLE